MLTFRPVYFALTVGLFLVEVAIALYVRDAFVRPYGGDFLVVMLVYCFLRAFVRQPPWVVAGATLGIAFAVEVGQAMHLVRRLGLAGNRLAETVLGTGFSWYDMLAYTLGVVVVYALDRRWGRA